MFAVARYMQRLDHLGGIVKKDDRTCSSKTYAHRYVHGSGSCTLASVELVTIKQLIIPSEIVSAIANNSAVALPLR
jgi:hypothetical protein